MALTRPTAAQINTVTTTISDPITVLNQGATLANIDVGLIINRDNGINSNVALYWNETTDTFNLAYTSSTGGSNANIAITNYADIKVNTLYGNIGGGSVLANTYVTGSLLPSANVTYDLGSPTQRWREGWFSGSTIHIGSESISVDNTGKWSFSSAGETVEMGKNHDFNPNKINVSGAIVGASLNVSGNVLASSLTGTLTTASQTNITAVGTLGSLGVAGTVTAGAFSGPLTGTTAGTHTGAVIGNASTATILQTARAINGVSFDGSAAITVTADASTLTGATLNSGVTASSLTSVGTLGSLAVTGAITAGSLVAGNVSISATADAITSTGTLTLDPNPVGTGGLVVIQGNLQVTGTTTTVNSTTLDVTDLNITVALGAVNAAAANGAGLTVAGAAATLLYTSATDTWNFNKNIVGTLATASQTNITAVGTLGSLAVTGAVSASSLAGTLTTASQTNITAVGTLGSLAVTGAITGAWLNVSGNVLASSLTGTLTSSTVNLTNNTLTGTTAQFDAALSDANFTTQTSATGSAKLPASTTANRDALPAAGYLRFNTSTAGFEGYDGTSWGSLAGGGGGGTPGGNDGQLQFNNASTFAGAGSLYYFSANGAILANAGIASTSTSTGTIQVVGGVGVSGTVTATTFSGSGASLTALPAGQLTGATLNSGVTASSLTSVGTLAGLAVGGAASISQDIRALGQIRAIGWNNTPTGASYTGLATEIGISAGEGYVLCYNRDTAAYGTLNLQASGSGLKISTGVVNVNSGSLQQGGNQVLHAGNYTSYSPSLTGGSASGTWGINVTGTAYGLNVHAARNNEADKVVRTDANGYIQAGWINTTSGDLGLANKLNRVWCSNDEYMRYLSLTDFKTQIGQSAKNSYNRRESIVDANYHVGSMGWSGSGANETFHGGSGFFDIWSGTNFPGSTTHIHGFNALHYTVNSLGSTGGSAYGIQVAGQYDQGGEVWSRGCSNGTFSSWRKQLDSTNYSAYSTFSGSIKRSATTGGYLDGQYSSVETASTSGAIYTIGGSYQPGGTTLGNMYGIGYGYAGQAGITGTGSPNSNWGMYVASGGTPRIFLNSDNGVMYGTASSARYADLAENYTSDEKYVPGTVVIFGGANEITKSTISHDPAVAGVVSTNPGYLMNNALDGISVALQGRVPTRVLGPVSKGDRLVSSSIPGVACKMDKTLYEPGCIIGKALASITTDEITTIEVVVGRL